MLLFSWNQDRSGRIKDATQSGPKSFAHSRRAVALKFDVRAMLLPIHRGSTPVSQKPGTS